MVNITIRSDYAMISNGHTPINHTLRANVTAISNFYRRMLKRSFTSGKAPIHAIMGHNLGTCTNTAIFPYFEAAGPIKDAELSYKAILSYFYIPENIATIVNACSFPKA